MYDLDHVELRPSHEKLRFPASPIVNELNCVRSVEDEVSGQTRASWANYLERPDNAEGTVPKKGLLFGYPAFSKSCERARACIAQSSSALGEKHRCVVSSFAGKRRQIERTMCKERQNVPER